MYSLKYVTKNYHSLFCVYQDLKIFCVYIVMKTIGLRYGYKFKDADDKVIHTAVKSSIKSVCDEITEHFENMLSDEYKGSSFVNYNNIRHLYSNPNRVNPWVKSRVEVFIVDLKKMIDSDEHISHIEFKTGKGTKRPCIQRLSKGKMQVQEDDKENQSQ